MWTIDEIDENEVIERKWWHQLGHRWQHYVRVVPGQLLSHILEHDTIRILTVDRNDVHQWQKQYFVCWIVDPGGKQLAFKFYFLPVIRGDHELILS